MKKNKILFFIFLSITVNFCYSQKLKIEFIVKNDSLEKKERNDFIYLAKETDVTNAKYIGRLKATNKFNYINTAIYLLKDKAQKKGANSFKFVDFKNENGINELIIDAYVIDNELKITNQNNLPKNKIYFFGKDNIEKEISEIYFVNDEEKINKSFHYTIIDFDSNMKISKGKTFGMTLNVKPNENKDSMFINFSGFGASTVSLPSGGIGIGFSGGSIIQMDNNYGLLLTNIYKQE